ncbi:TetR/AcrR family transcriptional regulator [Streptomyces sp. NPDC057199]|uniref:TetR/AcrR family transcriptional regulator n=1 Tax=Streptomyces sp. NPDC057199 TaxID=3346047 RepID=UPI00364340EF
MNSLNSPSADPSAHAFRSASAGSPMRGRARENAILAAALDLVAEVGFEALTMDAIATSARASKATIYSKWKTKDEIVAEALRRQSEGAHTVAAPDTGSLRGDLLATVGGIAAALRNKNGVSLVSLVEAVRDHSGLREAARYRLEFTGARAGEAIARQAIARGELTDDADVPACLKLAMGHLLFEALFTGQVPRRKEHKQLVDSVLLPVLLASSGGTVSDDEAERDRQDR